ncbi:hypothetical protein GCM10027074_76370 [Streptomyces deserti]
MISRGDLTDDEWDLLEPLLPVSNNRCGRWRNHRQVINGIIHRLGTGAQWRALPKRFGPWQTVHKRHLLWSADGTWTRLLQHLQAVADGKGDIDWDINVDSTSVRAPITMLPARQSGSHLPHRQALQKEDRRSSSLSLTAVSLHSLSTKKTRQATRRRRRHMRL